MNEKLPPVHIPKDIYIPHVERNGTPAKEIEFFMVEHFFSLPFTATDFFRQYSDWSKKDTTIAVSQSDIEETLHHFVNNGTLAENDGLYRWKNEA